MNPATGTPATPPGVLLAAGGITNFQVVWGMAFIVLFGLCGILLVWWVYRGLLIAAKENLAWLWLSPEVVDNPRINESHPAIRRQTRRIREMRATRRRLMAWIAGGTAFLVMVCAIILKYT